MILSGQKIFEEIRIGNIQISDFDVKRLNPNSYNLRLGYDIMRYSSIVLDPKKKNNIICSRISKEGYILNPGILYLCRTIEMTYTEKYVPMIEGRSSIGRLGLSIHITAGFGDIGYRGNWTLELSAIHPIKIYPEMEIAQIVFHTIEGDYDLYNGKYNNATAIKSSQMYKEFNDVNRKL